MILRVYTELDSTNAQAAALARQGESLPLAVQALRQTAGRGRLGRSFASEEGGLYLSYAFRPRCALGQVPGLTLLAGLAAADALESLDCPRPGIKWPNDLYLQGKKICGILTEAVDAGALTVIMGLGVNLYNRLPPELPQAGRLADLMDGAPRPEALAPVLLEKLEAVLSEPRESAMERYRAECITLGRRVAVTGADGGTCSGLAVGIAPTGALLVETAPGRTVEIHSGEATCTSHKI